MQGELLQHRQLFGGVSARVSRIDHVKLMSAVAVFKFAFKNSGVIVFQTAVPPERIANDDDSEDTGRLRVRPLEIPKAVRIEMPFRASLLTPRTKK